MRSAGAILCLLALVPCRAAQSIDAPRKAKQYESRIIVRYAESDSTHLQERVQRLEQLSEVKKAEALPRLDMAVVVLHSEETADDMIESLERLEGVELALLDTWVQADGFAPKPDESKQCSAHPKCAALRLEGNCCPTSDSVRLACCEDDDAHGLDGSEHGQSTISLKSFHEGYVIGHSYGHVGLHYDAAHPDIQFFVVPHADGYVSLKSRHGAYLVAGPSGRVQLWHRGHPEADDWEKFKLTYNPDGSISLRSKALDKFVAAEHPSWGVLSADRDEIDDWEKFNVTVTHGVDTEIPNDTSFKKLWGMYHFGGRDIDAVEAWKTFTGESPEGLVVAVIDTGIDYTHPDLKEQMWVNPGEIPGDGIDNDGNGFVDDIHGVDFANNDGDPMDDQMHGTHCSGTIAGRGNNSAGVAGVAWQGVRLMALKFLSATGGGRTSDAIKAVDYAVAMGAKLSSNSWGGGGSSSAMRVAIERAERAGMLFVAAAGNEGTDNDAMPHYPSNYPTANLLSVASTTYKGDLSSFSCYGQETVDVAAPGSDIFSTVPGGKYASLSGTSMACPHVSGLAALIWLFRPKLSMMQVKDIIMESTVKDHVLLGSSVTNGRINARRALELASQYEAPQPPVHAPQALAFEDIDPKVGQISGNAVITAAAIESDVEYYSLHFRSMAGFLMDSIGRANVTGEATLVVKLENLSIPQFAKSLAVVSANGDAKASASTAAAIDIEDYGVPESGPEGVAWGGDEDGRAGYVAGSIKVKRASRESTITKYNIYWKDGSQRGELLGTVPSVNFLRPSCEGDCALLNQSQSDGTYHFHRDAYNNDELAVITFSGPASVKITSFMTEKYYDYLEVAGQQITGTDLDLPKIVEVPAGPQMITWASDSSETEGGWTFELTQQSDTAEFQLPATKPPSMEVEVLAAYGKTELLEPSTGRLSDFDATSMPPSAAFAPLAVNFEDTDVSQGFIRGDVEIIPAAAGDTGIVTFYHVFLTNAEGKMIHKANWTVKVPPENNSSLKLPIAKMGLPAGAYRIVARAGNAIGESTVETSTALVDIIRSPPLAINFTGDTDPSEGKIRGEVMITPAENPADIVAYAVYLANGTMKETLLGRVVARTTNEDVSFNLHAWFQPHQTLLVVSVYKGFEMAHGVHAAIEDWVDADASGSYGYGGYGGGFSGGWAGRRMQEHDHRPLPKEPWLQKPLPATWKEIQILWTAEPDVSSTARMPLMQLYASPFKTGSRKLVLATLTIPGFLRTSSASSGESEFLPPSADERSALALALASVLPNVLPSQVKLLRGRAFKGRAARAGALTATGAGRKLSSSMENALNSNSACLVVDFEVSPSAGVASDTGAEQSFLDRVEARLITLSQGRSTAARLDSALEQHLQRGGPKLHALISEPQQVAPEENRAGRSLAAQAEVVLADEDEGEEEGQGSTIVAAVLGGVFGAIATGGTAAVLVMKGRQSSRDQQAAEFDGTGKRAASLEGIDVQLKYSSEK